MISLKMDRKCNKRRGKPLFCFYMKKLTVTESLIVRVLLLVENRGTVLDVERLTSSKSINYLS